MYNVDLWFFYLINHGMANPVFDLVMPFVTDVSNFYVVYAIVLLLVAWKGGSRGRWCVLLMLLAVALADPLNSRIVKEAVARVRPCGVLSDVRLLVPCGAGKSFPSSHAVNNFAAALIGGYFFPKARIYLFTFAALVAISRVYVGVHYPSDILGGALEGLLVSGLLLLVWKWWNDRYRQSAFV